MKLDLNFVHSCFPQYRDDPELVFCCNAGGSYVAQPVIDLLQHYDAHTRVQPYNTFSPSSDAGQAMDRAKLGWAQALNIDPSELTIGPSTSMNSYVMAQAIGAGLNTGDEIIVTQQDHEANIGVWRRMAEQKGATIVEWAIEPDSGLLDPHDLNTLVTSRTRWLFFTHCSNLMGTVNPVAEIVSRVKALGDIRIGVDAVAYAPHHICDLKALGVDMYLFSLYKVFGPHQGILYVNRELNDELKGQSHYFNADIPNKRYNPTGPQHAQVAGCLGVLDYFDALHEHHGGDAQASPTEKMQAIHELLAPHELALAAPVLEFLDRSPAARLLGKTHCRDADRAATIAFKPLNRSSAEVVGSMVKDRIGVEHGDFYAPRALEHTGIDTDDGVVRISLVHYNTSQDVERILTSLDRAL